MHPIARELLDLWFSGWSETEPLPEDSRHMALWWKKDPAVDADLRRRFGAAAVAARDGVHDDWADAPETCVALILLLDQIPRNIFRDTPEAFASDAHAREICKGAIGAQLDQRMPRIHRYFAYMPLMHSEDLVDHDLAVEVFERLLADAKADDSARAGVYAMALDYEHKHREIIERFGRYPHRNPILGREDTPEEADFDVSF